MRLQKGKIAEQEIARIVRIEHDKLLKAIQSPAIQ
jgi:hypothetical protein